MFISYVRALQARLSRQGGAGLLVTVLQRTVRTLRDRIASCLDDAESAKRAETLSRVFRYLVAAVVSLIAGMLVLAELGVSVAPILGAAGVVGLAVGFGAQSLVKDFFTGFFILLENQIRQGDVVQLGDHAGVVEGVNLRFVQLRDYDGNVHHVPNGHITTVINMTRGFSHAVMDIGVAYRENVDDVMAVMREYLRRLKAAFDAKGIEIPYPHMTVYAGRDKEGKAPAFPLQQMVEA